MKFGNEKVKSGIAIFLIIRLFVVVLFLMLDRKHPDRISLSALTVQRGIPSVSKINHQFSEPGFFRNWRTDLRHGQRIKRRQNGVDSLPSNVNIPLR